MVTLLQEFYSAIYGGDFLGSLFGVCLFFAIPGALAGLIGGIFNMSAYAATRFPPKEETKEGKMSYLVYEYYNYGKMHRGAKWRNYPVFILFVLSVVCELVGYAQNEDGLIEISGIFFLLSLGLAAILYMSSGGIDTINYIKKNQQEYLEAEYIREDTYEVDGGIGSSYKRLKSSRTYDKNAEENTWRFVFNLIRWFFGLVMYIGGAIAHWVLQNIAAIILILRKPAIRRTSKRILKKLFKEMAKNGDFIDEDYFDEPKYNRLPKEILRPWRARAQKLLSAKKNCKGIVMGVETINGEQGYFIPTAVYYSDFDDVEEEAAIVDCPSFRLYLKKEANEKGKSSFKVITSLPFFPSAEFAQSLLQAEQVEEYLLNHQWGYLRAMKEAHPASTRALILRIDPDKHVLETVSVALGDVVLNNEERSYTLTSYKLETAPATEGNP